MSVNEEIYDALSLIEGVDEVFDSKRPDNYTLTGAVLVFSSVSEVPEIPIDGAIIGLDQLWQVSVYVKDRAYLAAGSSPGDPATTPAIVFARSLKAAVIAALHAVSGTSIERCDFDAAHGEIPDAEGREYHIPIDFVIRTA